jgi:hypothetical protein
MRELDPDFRARARAWLDRASETPAHEMAARARGGFGAPNRRRRGRTFQLAWGVLAASVIFVAAVVLSSDRARNPPAPRYDSVLARPRAPIPRLVVVELRSGTRLFVDLAAGRSTS